MLLFSDMFKACDEKMLLWVGAAQVTKRLDSLPASVLIISLKWDVSCCSMHLALYRDSYGLCDRVKDTATANRNLTNLVHGDSSYLFTVFLWNGHSCLCVFLAKSGIQVRCILTVFFSHRNVSIVFIGALIGLVSHFFKTVFELKNWKHPNVFLPFVEIDVLCLLITVNGN